ncbi:hypothetical protein LXL04_019643 [Taraxacum kok-saghyz]
MRRKDFNLCSDFDLFILIYSDILLTFIDCALINNNEAHHSSYFLSVERRLHSPHCEGTTAPSSIATSLLLSSLAGTFSSPVSPLAAPLQQLLHCSSTPAASASVILKQNMKFKGAFLLTVYQMARKGKGKRTDPAWDYGKEVEVPATGTSKGYKYIKCNFCPYLSKGGVFRFKSHLGWTHQDAAPCPNVPEEVKQKMKDFLKNYETSKHNTQRNFEEMVDSGAHFTSGSGSGSVHPSSSRGVRGPMDRFVADLQEDDEGFLAEKMTPTKEKERRNQVCMDIGSFFFNNGIPFNPTTSAEYFTMLRSVGNYGRGFKPPSMHEMRTWVLDGEVKETTKIVGNIRETWKTTGVSILSDGWTIDASDCIKNAQKLFEMLDAVVEEIGEEIVIQVVTDNASAYKAAGRLLMDKRKSLYWTPCAAHCIDLMLEKLGELPEHKNALIKAKKVSNFIYNHQWVLSLARKYLKKDLLRPAATRFATAYLTIQSMYDVKQHLQQMFVSNE